MVSMETSMEAELKMLIKKFWFVEIMSEKVSLYTRGGCLDKIKLSEY